MHICRETIRVFFFNDGFSIFDPKTGQTIRIETPKEFRLTSDILSSEELFQSLFQYIIDKLAESIPCF